MMQSVELLTLHRARDLPYAILPTAEDEPSLLMSLAAAGDMQVPSDMHTPGPAAAERGDKESTAAGLRNREALLRNIGAGSSRLITLRQVHSRQVLWTDELQHENQEGDGLLTTSAGELPAVTVADCMPIFLFARGTAVRGIVHSGWKGTGIAAEAVQRIGERYGLQPHQITVVLGPSIVPCCYRVDKERAELFAGLWGAEAVQWREGGAYLDLPAANTGLLRGMGVKDLRRVDECTMCGSGFGSFRREGPQQFTHMLAMIADFPVD